MTLNQQIHEEAVKKYYANPNKCQFCGNAIKLIEGPKVIQRARRKKCCDRICAGKLKTLKADKLRSPKKCKFCGKTLNKNQFKFCSIHCQTLLIKETHFNLIKERGYEKCSPRAKEYLIRVRVVDASYAVVKNGRINLSL